jgi:glucose/mannose-6-phosphate isomerase
VGGSSLVIASSYSGNTEETLSALDEAIAAGAKCVAVGTGGKLEDRAEDVGIPFVDFEYASAPRAAIGYSFMLIAGVLRAAGLLPLEGSEVTRAAEAMRSLQREIGPDVPEERNAAKQLARKLHGRVPVVYGAGILSEVARRWKGQFNENSKAWSFFEVMPELNHNAVLGYTNPEDADQRLAVVMLRSKLDHPRVKVRFDVTAGLLQSRGVPLEMVEGRGDSALEQMFTTIHFGDYVSVYLAYLYGSDPTPVDAISYLKEQLARA